VSTFNFSTGETRRLPDNDDEQQGQGGQGGQGGGQR